MARYLLVGHLTRDLLPGGGFRYGGAVLYAGLTARRLGFEARVVTSSAEGDLEHLFPELWVQNLPSPVTTVFENLELAAGRRQFVRARGEAIRVRDLAPEWRRAEIVHLAPVLDEVAPEEAALFETGFLVANPQGWFREVGPGGEVRPRVPDLSRAPRFRALVVSEEDLGGREELVEALLGVSETVVVTLGARGARLVGRDGGDLCVPTRAARVRDTVGAGDVFAAAFFAMLYASADEEEALRFASCLAAVSVTRAGLASVPTGEEVSACLEAP